MQSQTEINAPVPLKTANLQSLPGAVKVPGYDRSKLTAGIVHIGLGNFHRGHQAWYLHRLMQQGLAHDWAILGAGVRPGDAAMRERLCAQDCLTTLVELDPAGTSVEVIGSMIDFIEVDPANGPLIAAMSDPQIRIVSLTVTEGGYYQTEAGALDIDHPDIKHDIEHPQTPITAFGAMIAAYRARRDAGLVPFTGQCCDNLQNNGAVLRQTVVGLAQLIDPDLAQWIDTNASFPNAMVDCIVPATGEADLTFVRQLGILDAAPVTHENFRQWVIEDDFCAARPPWEKVGVTLTDNVHAYESMKIRVLNAGHQVLANVGEVLGLETIADCMADRDVAGFFHDVETDCILPHVDAVEGVSADDYLKLIETRFANPLIRDTTRRVAFDGSSRHPGFVLPILRDALAAGTSIEGLALVEAFWARMCEGTRENGQLIEPNDPAWDDLQAAAKRAKDDPNIWLQQSQYYGDLAQDARFAQCFATWLKIVWAEGAKGAMARYSADQ